MSTWILDDLSVNMDVMEDDRGVTQTRLHVVIQIHAQISALSLPSNFDLGDAKRSITYNVGSVVKTLNPGAPLYTAINGSTSGGGASFICVGDGASPIEHPGDYVVRTQTWEYFGPLGNAPAGWNQ